MVSNSKNKVFNKTIFKNLSVHPCVGLIEVKDRKMAQLCFLKCRWILRLSDAYEFHFHFSRSRDCAVTYSLVLCLVFPNLRQYYYSPNINVCAAFEKAFIFIKIVGCLGGPDQMTSRARPPPSPALYKSLLLLLLLLSLLLLLLLASKGIRLRYLFIACVYK